MGLLKPQDLMEASVLILRLSYPTETVLSNKITRNRIVLSFKDSPRKALGRRPLIAERKKMSICTSVQEKVQICEDVGPTREMNVHSK